MSDNKQYWIDRKNRAKRAEEHTRLMADKCKFMVEHSVQCSKIYGNEWSGDVLEMSSSSPEIVLENADTVTAILNQKCTGHKLAALNFASYKNPGGMFLEGSRAQEECLCHESDLYNVLKVLKEYYAWNNKNLNKALYLNRAAYTPDIYFYRTAEKQMKVRYCDIITCAAPNYMAASQYQKVSREENYHVLEARIKFILDITDNNRVHTLILGAFGCGGFGQDPVEVAELFKKHLVGRHMKKVIFAVPGNDANYEAFKKVFGR